MVFVFFFLLEAVKRFRYKNYEYYSRIFLILFSFRFCVSFHFLEIFNLRAIKSF